MSKMLFVNPILSNLELKDLLFQGKIVKFTDCKQAGMKYLSRTLKRM